MSFEIKITANIFEINFNSSFRNKDWANDFGIIQKSIDERKYKSEEFIALKISFEKCEWVDPTPLLSLSISLKEFYKLGGKTIIILPVVVGSAFKDSDKVVKFLHEEGFLETFAECAKVVDSKGTVIYDLEKKTKNTERLKSFSNIRSSLYYTNSTLLNCSTIDTKELFGTDLEKVDKWVEEKIQVISTRLSDKVPSFSQNSILHRLTILMVEMIQNIVKHAYEDSPKSFAGVYVRYRNGLDNNSLGLEERRKLDIAFKEEVKNCPRLSREYLDVRKGCIEVFIIDSGHGFTETLRSSLQNNETKNPFRQAYDIVFKEGKRRKYKDLPDSTFQGGLFYVGEMLQANQDYICGRDENEWVGGLFPLVGDVYEYCKNKESKDDVQVTGLSWIVRLSWRHETEYGKENWSVWQGSATQNPVYKELEESSINISPSEFYTYDFRFNVNDIIPDFSIHSKPENDNLILLFPHINQTKFGIWKLIERISSRHEKAAGRVLFIADIPEYEKQVYIYALNKINIVTNRDRHWINKFDKIILVTRRLSVSILEKVENTYRVVSDEDRIAFFDGTDNKIFRPDICVAHLVAWIRSYDSLLFWSNIKLQNTQKQFYVNGKIEWTEKLPLIEGYLDYAQAATDNLCMNLFRIAIERIVGVFGEFYEEDSKHCKFINIDVLTKRIVDEANATFFNEIKHENAFEVYVGSVFVSGTSKDDAMFYLKEKKSNSIIHVHFFLHKSSKVSVPHLFNWPKEDWLKKFEKSEKIYKRVGRTHVIAEHGYKSFTMPRFMDKTRESAYYRNPRSTYKDWQNEKNQIISFGHFEFEGKHDLFKINIIKLIDESFLFNHELSKFLVSEFFIALGGKNKNQLRNKGEIYFDFIQERKENQDDKIDEVALIAYSNNSNSAYIVDKIKELFIPEFSQKMFALMPINKERVGSSLLISPLVFEPIKEVLKNSRDKKVLLFDSSVISGRTRKELKHLLFSLGAKEVRTLSITDRFRLPFKVPDKTKHRSYWRLDLPRLGNADTCPICKGIELVDNFKNELASKFSIDRISIWKEKWKAISYFNSLADHGIRPTPITTTEKKFGIEYDEETKSFIQIVSKGDKEKNIKNQIELKNSLGLTLYVTELHAMTSRDDLALKLCKKIKDLSAPAKIELLSSQLLLFPNEYSKNIQFEMVLSLFNACNEIKYPDNWTSLASLVLLIQDKALHSKLIEELKVSGTKDFKVSNIDLDILLAYILRYHTDDKLEFSQKIYRLLKFNDEEKIANIYRQFHREIYDDNGGPIHSKPLISFYKKDETPREESLRNSINSISKIQHILQKIENWHFRKRSKNIVFPFAMLTACKNKLDEFYNKFKSVNDKFILVGKDYDSDTAYKKEFDKLKYEVEFDLIPHLKTLHEFLYCSIFNIANEPYLINEIENILKSITKFDWDKEADIKNKIFLGNPPIIKLSVDASIISNNLKYQRQNAWIILDELMESEIRYSIINAIHSKRKIKDLWSVDANNVDEADMWINIEYNSEQIKIVFANLSKMPASEIKLKVNEKKKEGLLHLEHDLNGKFHVEEFAKNDDGTFIIKVILIIPII